MTHDSASEAFTRSVLVAIGCPRQQTHSILQIAIPAVTLVAIASATFILIKMEEEDELLETLAFIVAVGGFALGLVQWNSSRLEVSFDKFYDRISLTKNYINEVGLREAANKEQELDHVKNMRVFAQLDNQEYVLGKYELNFVGFDIVDRVMRTFVAECDQPWFREKVLFWIGRAEGEQVASKGLSCADSQGRQAYRGSFNTGPSERGHSLQLGSTGVVRFPSRAHLIMRRARVVAGEGGPEPPPALPLSPGPGRT